MNKAYEKLVAKYKRGHPVGENRRSHRWGYERTTNDCLNLTKCPYHTKRAAELARHREAMDWAADQLGLLPPGEYYVGDLRYALQDVWTEVHELSLPPGNDEGVEGQFRLKDGRRFSRHWTAHGDGCLEDGEGRVYPVDSGSIGCIRLSEVKTVEGNSIVNGNVVDFPEPFKTSSDRGVIDFGGVVLIDTDQDETDEEP